MEQYTGSKLIKEYNKSVYCHPVFNLYAEHIIWNAGLDELQVEIKIARKYQQTHICRLNQFNGRKWSGIKEPVDEGEREECNAGLKFNIKNTEHQYFTSMF